MNQHAPTFSALPRFYPVAAMLKAIIILLFTCLTAVTSFAATTYLNTGFEGESVGQFSATTNTTGLINDADTQSKVEIVATVTSSGSTVNDPSGQHLKITGNLNKRATQENAMTLISDGVNTLNINFSYYLNDAGGNNGDNIGRIIYSALGDFSDQVVLESYAANTVGVTQWTPVSITLSSTDVTFTDTAKLRFAQDSGGAFNTSFLIDDVLVQGVPEPSSTALLGLGGLALCFLRRRR